MWLEALDEAIRVLAGSAWGWVSVDVTDEPYSVWFRLDEQPWSAPADPDEDYDEEPAVRWFVTETLADEELPAGHALSDAQRASLVRLGWLPPETECWLEDCPSGHDGRFQLVILQEGAAPSPEVVGLVLATLGVYGADEGAEVVVSYHCSAGKKDLRLLR